MEPTDSSTRESTRQTDVMAKERCCGSSGLSGETMLAFVVAKLSGYYCFFGALEFKISDWFARS